MDQQQIEETGSEATTAPQLEEAPDKIEREYYESLSCPMTDKERKDANNRLLSLLDMIDNETAAMDSAKKLAKAKIEEHEAEVKRIRLELQGGKIDKPVKCEEQFFYRVGLVHDVRTDTGEVIDERAMTIEERQPSLFNGDGDGEDSETTSDEDGDEPPPELSTQTGRSRKRKN